MGPEYFIALFAYDDWANRRILTTAEGLSDAELVSTGPDGGASLRSKLAHVVGVEWLWYRRCHGESPTALPSDADFPTHAALVSRFEQEAGRWREYVAGLDDAGLQRLVRYRNTRGEQYEFRVWQILAHVVNHGTQHRSEAAVILTELGRSPGDMDLTVFLREQQ